MSKYVLLFEEFIPKETDSVESWDIPTSKNCKIETITLCDEDGGKVMYSQDDYEGILAGDVFFNNNSPSGYQGDLYRQWIDTTLGNNIMNYLHKNHNYLKNIVMIEVELLPEGAKKTFCLNYDFDGSDYKLRDKRYLPLN
jgi:hypothetical protein